MKIHDWFRHDSDARNDPRLIKLRMKFGNTAGLGAFWIIIEMLRNQTDYKIPFNSETDIDAVAYELRYDRTTTESFVVYGIDIGLFYVEEGMLGSRSLDERMECLEMARQQRINAINSRWDKIRAQKEASPNGNLANKDTAVLRTNYDGDTGVILSKKVSKEERKKVSKKGAPLTVLELIFPIGLESPECKAGWQRWLEYKQSRRESYKSVESQQAQLVRLKNDGLTGKKFLDAIQFSIAQNYAGIYPESKTRGKGAVGESGYSESFEHNVNFIKNLED